MAINPQSEQMVNHIKQVMGKVPLPQLEQFYQMAVECLKNPQQYPQLLQQVIATGKVKQGELPAQYNENVVKALAVALQIAVAQKRTEGGQGQQQGQPQGAQPLQMPKTI